MAVTQTDSIEDEFQQGLQEVGEMRDKYERLLAAVADAQERAAGALLGGFQACVLQLVLNHFLDSQLLPLLSVRPSPAAPHALVPPSTPPPRHMHAAIVLAPLPPISHAAAALPTTIPLIRTEPVSLHPSPLLRASECAEALHQLAAVVAEAFGGVEEGGAGDTLVAAAAVDGRLAELLYFYPLASHWSPLFRLSAPPTRCPLCSYMPPEPALAADTGGAGRGAAGGDAARGGEMQHVVETKELYEQKRPTAWLLLSPVPTPPLPCAPNVWASRKAHAAAAVAAKARRREAAAMGAGGGAGGEAEGAGGAEEEEAAAREEFDEVAMTLGCRILALQQRQPRLLLTLAVKHHAAKVGHLCRQGGPPVPPRWATCAAKVGHLCRQGGPPVPPRWATCAAKVRWVRGSAGELQRVQPHMLHVLDDLGLVHTPLLAPVAQGDVDEWGDEGGAGSAVGARQICLDALSVPPASPHAPAQGLASPPSPQHAHPSTPAHIAATAPAAPAPSAASAPHAPATPPAAPAHAPPPIPPSTSTAPAPSPVMPPAPTSVRADAPGPGGVGRGNAVSGGTRSMPRSVGEGAGMQSGGVLQQPQVHGDSPTAPPPPPPSQGRHRSSSSTGAGGAARPLLGASKSGPISAAAYLGALAASAAPLGGPLVAAAATGGAMGAAGSRGAAVPRGAGAGRAGRGRAPDMEACAAQMWGPLPRPESLQGPWRIVSAAPPTPPAPAPPPPAGPATAAAAGSKPTPGGAKPTPGGPLMPGTAQGAAVGAGMGAGAGQGAASGGTGGSAAAAAAAAGRGRGAGGGGGGVGSNAPRARTPGSTVHALVSPRPSAAAPAPFHLAPSHATHVAPVGAGSRAVSGPITRGSLYSTFGLMADARPATSTTAAAAAAAARQIAVPGTAGSSGGASGAAAAGRGSGGGVSAVRLHKSGPIGPSHPYYSSLTPLSPPRNMPLHALPPPPLDIPPTAAATGAAAAGGIEGTEGAGAGGGDGAGKGSADSRAGGSGSAGVAGGQGQASPAATSSVLQHHHGRPPPIGAGGGVGGGGTAGRARVGGASRNPSVATIMSEGSEEGGSSTSSIATSPAARPVPS
ncbi:unnamed protein product [Closterium sp. NIES-64]|nr:unnamed protein product [Closterium sp. NIES-64]